MSDWIGIVVSGVSVLIAVYSAAAARRANQRVDQIKALDLRLELRKTLGDTHESLSVLRELIAEAEVSRPRVLSMQGNLGGALTGFNQMVAADRTRLDAMVAPLPSEVTDYSSHTPEQLEKEIVTVHRIAANLATMNAKYRAELEQDNEARRMKMHSMNATTAALIGKR
jgi:hypothetical protein